MITLNTETEKRAVEFLARKRYAHCREVGAVAVLYGAVDSNDKEEAIKREMDYIGAEIAFCKLHNIYPDLTHDIFPPFDCIMRGQRIDVKQASKEHHRLLCKVEAVKLHIRQEKELPDWYALMIGVMPTYRFAGFMSAEELLQDKRIVYNLDVPAYTATQDELIMGLAIAEGLGDPRSPMNSNRLVRVQLPLQRVGSLTENSVVD